MQSSDSHNGPLSGTQDAQSFAVDNQAAPQARPAGFFEQGEIIGGSYEVLDFLGRGAMGMVYKVRHVS
ncbi:MAG: hypothetical protein JSS86_21070, partial [Cyanobacteria bacterium SZAS LIN-2]|nr:hypothetical protein [Cyanobacteria bacterium SZAS LIN-2]